MGKKRIFFVVGHENFGKSETLRSLLAICPRRGRRVTIKDTDIFIRQMSNDDQPDTYSIFIEETVWTVIIAALCPKFKKLGNANKPTKYIDGMLRSLRHRGYEMHFWVLKHQWGTSEVVTEDELDQLRRFGHVEEFKRGDESETRAKKLRAYVSKVLA